MKCCSAAEHSPKVGTYTDWRWTWLIEVQLQAFRTSSPDRARNHEFGEWRARVCKTYWDFRHDIAHQTSCRIVGMSGGILITCSGQRNVKWVQTCSTLSFQTRSHLNTCLKVWKGCVIKVHAQSNKPLKVFWAAVICDCMSRAAVDCKEWAEGPHARTWWQVINLSRAPWFLFRYCLWLKI